MTEAPDHTTAPTSDAPAATAPVTPAERVDASAPAADMPSADAPGRKRSRGGRGRRGGKGERPATAEGDAPAAQTAPPPAGKPARKNGTSAPRKVHPVLERLFELYPQLFGARFRPLKLGIYQELLAAHGDEFKAEDLKLAMGLHARSTRYLECVAAGHPRHDLQGRPVEPVAPEHIHHAILEVFRRRQGRTQDDLSGQLRDRIIAAIEASGVGREAYAERVRARDDASNAALDDALAELARQAAKREALMRAFEANGKTEAEFAEMYGMDLKDVAYALARARRDKADDEKRAAEAALAVPDPEIDVPEAPEAPPADDVTEDTKPQG
ncbi:ProQ/FINO family protein [Variovorax guangxiensis]|uniref:Fertility inhibition FinO n=1 Tax=Variovorax guangxiensis TaxID=1775474 RepID=A0A502DWH7_9BURK|nr:ProQ/FINO family protein [Variovorax guangxiensis]TPG24482.1 Fertility inhibition FinO [Variovorax ginsengisoli]TPG28732.1 Fertility inhibition FinO [Variovorax guangxiensis]